jgi:hypothetical protein
MAPASRGEAFVEARLPACGPADIAVQPDAACSRNLAGWLPGADTS